MCGRYASTLPPEMLAELFQTSGPLPNFPPTWNMAPTQTAPVIRRHPETRERRIDVLTWGLVPHFTTDPKTARRPINARAETIATSGVFRAAVRDRRCIIPATAFYEWRDEPAGKQPFAIARQDGAPLALAGVWESWRNPDGEVLRTYAIVTTTANATMSLLHDRMPVILEAEDWPVWMGEAIGRPSELMRPAAEGVLHMWPVGRAVGNVRNDGPELLEAIPDGAGAGLQEDAANPA